MKISKQNENFKTKCKFQNQMKFSKKTWKLKKIKIPKEKMKISKQNVSFKPK